MKNELSHVDQRTLAGLKRRGTLGRWKEEQGDRLVRIWSGQWSSWWRPERRGYTNRVEEAGVYTLRDAVNASGHCGPEKGLVYQFLPVGAGQLTQEEQGAARLMLGMAGG